MYKYDKDGIQVEMYGFEETKDLNKFVNEELQRLKELCPSDSKIHLFLSKYGEEFKGDLNIYSPVFRCSETKCDQSLVDIVTALFQTTEKNISKWKSLRFNAPQTRKSS